MHWRKLFAYLIISSMLTAALPGTALADSNSQKIYAQALGIRAPQIIEVNQSFTLQTIEKYTRNTEPNVAIYAVKATELNQSLTDNSTGNATILMNNYADIAKKIGAFLGNTDANGQLTCTLTAPQNYVLIAIKNGFTPGFTRINVVLALKKNLQINAPNIAEDGQQISIMVTELPIFKPVTTIPKVISQKRGDDSPKATTAQILSIRQIPVADASVYAIKTTLAAGIVAQAHDKNNQITDNYTAMVKEKGFFIGTTEGKGQLYHTFNDVDRYVLIAVKDSYVPGFTRINIVIAGQKALRIEAPNIAESGKTVTMTVAEKGYLRTGTAPIIQAPTPSSNAQPSSIVRFSPVAGASIYSIKVKDYDPINDILKQANGNEKAAAEKYAALAREKGILLGTTKENGQLDYPFIETGKYVLVAVKDGYRADFTRIGIVLAEKKALRLNAGESALIGQQVIVVVTEKVKILSVPHSQDNPKTITNAQRNPSQTTATQMVIAQPGR